MSKFTKRTNKLDMEWFLVAGGDQALAATNPLFSTSTAMNIADRQLAIVSAETGEEVSIEEKLTPGNVYSFSYSKDKEVGEGEEPTKEIIQLLTE